MAKKPKRNAQADVLEPAPSTDPNVVMRAWHQAPIIPPEVLQQWLDENIIRVATACRQLHDKAADIREGTDVEKRQAYDVMIHGKDFFDIAKPALVEMTEAVEDHYGAASAVAMAMATGIRLGMLYERLESLAHGRLKRIWEDEDQAEAMRKAKAKADAERQAEKRRKADDAMAWAKHAFPTAAHDDYVGFLKDKAKDRLQISRDTLDRWLKF